MRPGQSVVCYRTHEKISAFEATVRHVTENGRVLVERAAWEDRPGGQEWLPYSMISHKQG
jgi:hypothetical protein